MKMWSLLIDLIPERNLDSWASGITVISIFLALLSGIAGWIAFDVASKASVVKERIFSERIEAAELASRPKPLKQRLLEFLTGLDPRIIPSLESGNASFNGTFPQRKVHEFEALCDEDGADAFIELNVNPRHNVMIDGTTNPTEIEFTLKSALLK